jgi:group I intron endonuclease
MDNDKYTSGVIYIITNVLNNKKYIGQAIGYSSCGRKWGSLRRWQKHVSNAKNNVCECRLLENSIRKNGEKSFIVEDLLTCNITQLNYYEDKFIQLYNTIAPNGYNLMTGGGNGRRHSEETRQKMTNTRTGMVKKKETRQKIGSSRKKNYVNEMLKEALDNLKLEVPPTYIYYGKRRNNIEVRVPSKPLKSFGIKDMKLEEKIKFAIQYKDSLTTTVIGSSEFEEELEV